VRGDAAREVVAAFVPDLLETEVVVSRIHETGVLGRVYLRAVAGVDADVFCG
jgi:hypothetical protein